MSMHLVTNEEAGMLVVVLCRNPCRDHYQIFYRNHGKKRAQRETCSPTPAIDESLNMA